MALLNRLSIKWKLSLAIIASGLLLVSAYVFLANRVFRTDKISYVFDSQASTLDSIKSVIESKFGSLLVNARVIVSTFDFKSISPSKVGQEVFTEDKSLVALELWSTSQQKVMIHLEKNSWSLPEMNNDELNSAPGTITLRFVRSGYGILNYRYAQTEQGHFHLRAGVDLSQTLPNASIAQSFALIQNGIALYKSDYRDLDEALFDEVARITKPTDQLRTKTWQHNKINYLVSESPVGIGDMVLVVLTPESEALGALNTLRDRSIVFILFSTFGLILISLTTARGLTSNLKILTNSALAIGAGNFDSTPSIQSGDEIGVLAKAFTKMSQEIKRLLAQMHEKFRMEEELKTAKLIQERLLPKEQDIRIGDIEINGIVLTSSECGGDWWFYFQRGDEVFVAIADATGHGTPAALITAAARSVFSQFQNEELTLNEMMCAWDLAVSSCAQGHVCMTGQLMRINVKTGKGSIVNAAHESPFLFKQTNPDVFQFELLELGVSKRIGDDYESSSVETEFELEPDDCLVLYTDGLFSVVKKDGHTLSERRLGKVISQKAATHKSAKQITDLALELFHDHREGLPLPDDVSIVSVRRVGTGQSNYSSW